MQTNQDSLKELEKDQGPVRRWITEVKLAEKYPENWKKRTDEVVGRYRDERAPASKSPLRYNVLWANTSILEPAVYNGVPKSIIERRFKDRDPVGRLASRLLQRCSQFSIDDYDFDYNCRLFRKDFLLCGQGVGRIYYYKTEGEVLKDGSGNVVYADAKETRPLREVLSERVRLEYVHRHDFFVPQLEPGKKPAM